MFPILDAYKGKLHFALNIIKDIFTTVSLLRNNKSIQKTYTKMDGSKVTSTDIITQYLIVSKIKKLFPSDNFLCEENSISLNNEVIRDCVFNYIKSINKEISIPQIINILNCSYSGDKLPKSFWCIDPIDGTNGFISDGDYAIAMSYINNNSVEFGILACPNFNITNEYGNIFFAAKGLGAFSTSINDHSLNQIKLNSVNSVIGCSGKELSLYTNKKKKLISCVKESNFSISKIKFDNQAMYCKLLKGDFGAYLRFPLNNRPHEQIWDHAPGYIIAKEAGYHLSDLNNQDILFDAPILNANCGIIASHPEIHKQILDLLK